MRIATLITLIAVSLAAASDSLAGEWLVGAYLDAGYLNSDNKPDNQTWRNKATSSRLDRVETNMVTAYVGKEATSTSRWGAEFGLQMGTDVDGLITSAPPPAYEPVSNANTWKHISVTTIGYLFPAGRGLLVSGGLLSSFIGYESFYSHANHNYTRAYATDNVPYFLIGIQASYPFSEQLAGAFTITTGYNYLTDPNSSPSWGAQVTWQPTGTFWLGQNLYYGPDQSDTSLEYWRFLSNTIAEWQTDRFLLAASFDYGNERQAWLPDTPYQKWMAGAIWGQMTLGRLWRVAVRPEIYWDPDGLITGARQTLRAVTTTLEFRSEIGGFNEIAARLEYRYDHSTGDEGGFYAGDDNHLVPDQNLLMLGLSWSFEWQRNEIN